jgi:H+/Cl- antiporter ClcA
MTGNVTLLLQTLGACATAMLVPALLRNAPIYASLREAMLRRARGDAAKTAATSASAAGEDSADRL